MSLIAAMVFVFIYEAMQIFSSSAKEQLTIVPRPFLSFESNIFEGYSMIRDIWEESFEQPLNTTNHYWNGSEQELERSTLHVNEGNYSLWQHALNESWAKYEFGSENLNNSFYVATPAFTNFSAHWYAEAAEDIQISLAIDDSPYGAGYDYELIYYWGEGSGVEPMFVINNFSISMGPATLDSWVQIDRNWTLDGNLAWLLVSPRIEAIALRICTNESLISEMKVWWDNLTFYGKWQGVEKTIEIQLGGEVYTKKFNASDTWNTEGSQTGYPRRANSTSANDWYYKWWGQRKIYVINSSGTYDITSNSSYDGVFIYHDNDWNPEDDTAIDDWRGYVKCNVTDFKLTNYKQNMEYQDYVLIEYVILFCAPSGSFKFDSNSTATAANDPDAYGGVEYWLLDKQGNIYRNYITNQSTRDFTFGN